MLRGEGGESVHSSVSRLSTLILECRRIKDFHHDFLPHYVNFTISDPADFPDLAEGELPDVSVPTFTEATKMTRTSQRKAVGDTVSEKQR